MTVSYTSRVTKSKIGCFIKVIFMWKGSIYKLVYKEFLIFILIYYAINFFYRFAMNDFHKRVFEEIVLYCDTFVNLIPLPFVLGFFVSLIVGRWWSQFQAIPWPDELMILVNCLIPGTDEKTRLIRRTLMRYLNLCSVLIFRSISAPVKKRFPDMESLVEAGFMTCKELQTFENIATPHSKWWVPCSWFANLLTRSYQEKRLLNDLTLRILLMNLIEYRNKCASLYAFDWISIPLVYTQVVTLANYMYFMANLMGRQILDPRKHYSNRFDIYFPIFTFLQFLFYMGWLKVAEQLMNPFGEDEDDFEINWIIDRNFQVSMVGVDELHNTFPDLEKDVYWDEPEPDLPYTEAAKFYKRNSWMGSTADVHQTRDDGNEFHKDWISQENLKNLLQPPINNFQEALFRFSSKSFARSRKSNQSIKSEDYYNEKGNGFLRNGWSTHQLNLQAQKSAPFNFPNHYVPSTRSSIANHLMFRHHHGGSNQQLTPIKEQMARFEVTKVPNPEEGDKRESLDNAAQPIDNQSAKVNGCTENRGKQLIDSPPETRTIVKQPCGRKKKISATSMFGGGGEGSIADENDLTVKGNISNLAKFHNKKMRERLLKSSSAGYVADDFTNNDTAYLKRSTLDKRDVTVKHVKNDKRGKQRSQPDQTVVLGSGGRVINKSTKPRKFPRALLRSIHNNFQSKTGKRFWHLSIDEVVDGANSLNKNQNSLVTEDYTTVPADNSSGCVLISSNSRKKGTLKKFVASLAGKRGKICSVSSSVLLRHHEGKKRKREPVMKTRDFHPFLGSRNYEAPEKRNWTNSSANNFDRASISSEIKSWITPVNRNLIHIPDIRITAPVLPHHHYESSNLGYSKSTFDDQDDEDEETLNGHQETGGVLHVVPQSRPLSNPLMHHLPFHYSPSKRSIYKRQMSLPHNGRLLEEEEPPLPPPPSINNTTFAGCQKTTKVVDDNVAQIQQPGSGETQRKNGFSIPLKESHEFVSHESPTESTVKSIPNNMDEEVAQPNRKYSTDSSNQEKYKVAEILKF